MRTILLFLLLVTSALSYHFWRVTFIQDEQIRLLREQVSLASSKSVLTERMSWLFADGVRMCAEDLIEAPKWLGLLTKKPEVVAVRSKRIKVGIGGGP